MGDHTASAFVNSRDARAEWECLGVDLYEFFLDLQSSEPETVVLLQFWQNDSPPEPLSTVRTGHRAQGVADRVCHNTQITAIYPGRTNHANNRGRHKATP
jgi:hypothetical protein